MTTEQLLQEPKLAEAVRRLQEAYGPERIYLFGSHAPGGAGEDSDYDLLVVVADDSVPAARIDKLGYLALREPGIAADVVICTHTYFAAREHLKAARPGIVTCEEHLLYPV